MSTDDLIARLGATAAARRPPRASALIGAAIAVGLASAMALVMALWGPRHDMAQAVQTAGFWMKGGYAVALAAAGVLLMERLGRPGERAPVGMGLAGAALALALLLSVRELMLLPPDLWMKMVKGHSWAVCSLRIAGLSLPGFAAGLWALRRMAPTRPRLAGAAAGLMAGGLGATAYALACNETAAVFLGTWYSLGMLAWAVVGALAGPRLLRW